ncbi:hypothetical protein N2E09_01655 [Leuconostoc citreum]
MEDNKKTELHITLTQSNYINSLFDRPMLAIDVNKKTFRPVNDVRFHDWLQNITRGEQE